MEECIICFEETSKFMFYTCAHKVCNNCYPKIRTCPICNTPRESEIIIIHPRHTIYVEDTRRTYNFILCISTILITSFIALYFYNTK
jgi:hypothetical protein